MPRSSFDNEPATERLAPAAGLQHFRTVAGGRHQRDDPLGSAPDRKARTMPDVPPPAPAPSIPKPPRESQKNHAPAIIGATPSNELAEEGGRPRVFAENVTVPLSVALRDRSEELARTLNRNRKVRKERITRNSVIRVALEQFLDTFTSSADQAIECEADLLAAARSKPRRS